MRLKVRINIFFLAIVLFIVSINSCEYEPTEKFNRNVNQNVTPPNIQIVSLNINRDTLYLFADTLVDFRFNSNNQAISAVQFLIDNQIKETVNSNTGTFDIQIANLTNGIHKMQINIYTASNTGSIADKVGAEAFVASKTWTLNVIKSLNSQIQTSVENGLLKINWSQPITTYIKEFTIYRNNIAIGSTKLQEFIDSSYVGQGANYAINVITINNSLFPLGDIQISPQSTKLYFVVTRPNKYTIIWDKNKYYNAIDFVKISFIPQSGVNKIEQIIKTSNEPNDTICQISNFTFGNTNKYILSIKPKKASYQIITEKDILMGIQIPIPISDIYQMNSDTCIINSSGTIYRYSIFQNKIIDNFNYKLRTDIQAEIDISPLGKLINVSYGNLEHVTISTDNLQIIKDNIITNIVKNFDLNIYNINYPISDIGTGIISSKDSLFLIDNNNSLLLSGYPIYMNTDKSKISTNGDYFFQVDALLNFFQYKNQKINLVWHAPLILRNCYFDFVSNDPNKLVFWDGSTFYLKNCSDFSTINEFNLSTSDLINIDFYLKEILTYDNGHFYVYSLNDGSLLYDVPTQNQQGFLVNKTIIIYGYNSLIYLMYYL